MVLGRESVVTCTADKPDTPPLRVGVSQNVKWILLFANAIKDKQSLIVAFTRAESAGTAPRLHCKWLLLLLLPLLLPQQVSLSCGNGRRTANR